MVAKIIHAGNIVPCDDLRARPPLNLQILLFSCLTMCYNENRK